jgi:hypothetical protein
VVAWFFQVSQLVLVSSSHICALPSEALPVHSTARALRNYLSCLICACLSPLSWPRAGWLSLAFYAYLLNYYMISVDQLSRVGIGTSRAASLGSRMSSADFTTFLKLATEGGVNLIDTSDFYGSGDAERLIGQTLKKTGYPFFDYESWLTPRPHSWLAIAA